LRSRVDLRPSGESTWPRSLSAPLFLEAVLLDVLLGVGGAGMAAFFAGVVLRELLPLGVVLLDEVLLAATTFTVGFTSAPGSDVCRTGVG
jgi:hypothetical protein